jgi:hypothetical protein
VFAEDENGGDEKLVDAAAIISTRMRKPECAIALYPGDPDRPGGPFLRLGTLSWNRLPFEGPAGRAITRAARE